MMAADMAFRRGSPFTGKTGLPSKKWWKKFTERHKLSLKRGQSFGKARTSFTEDTLKTFYDNIYKMMTENEYDYNFLESPHLIFNCDETGVSFDEVGKLIISAKGMLSFILHVLKSLHKKYVSKSFSCARVVSGNGGRPGNCGHVF